MSNLDSRAALVTGGASGIGKAIAQRLAADGMRVVITDIHAEPGYAAAAECNLQFLEQDVCDEDRWTQVVSEIENRFGRLHVLVNSAGISGPMDAATPENTRLADWRRVFAINVDGVFLGCRAVIPAMRRAGGGAIVNVSSVASLVASSTATAYGASKAAVRHFTKSVAQYCAHEKLNIRCNSVHPGPVLTPLLFDAAHGIARSRGIGTEEVLEEMKNNVPLGGLILPEDVAAAVSFLVSNDARQITGGQMLVDGGRVYCGNRADDHPSSSR